MGVARLAPSPTGAQHLGNARTFLIAYWSARASGSRIILRIEDVDSPRVKPWAIRQAIDDLRWLGIDWDEGPDVGGPNAPYIQTQRLGRYRTALDSIIDSGRAYPCTCTRKDILLAGSAPHFEHEGPIYPGTCANWRLGDPLPIEGSFCWRFRTRADEIAFDDIVHGTERCTPASDLGDFPITQKSGLPSYQLAVVADDAQMQVTEVVRGDDLLPSAFRQLELYAALGLQPPRFAHVPLVVGEDGRRLAKRHGDTRLSHYRNHGIDPRSIVAWAFQSAGLGAVETPQTAADLIDRFDWDRIIRTPGRPPESLQRPKSGGFGESGIGDGPGAGD
jgi:glutamyl-tRNA synthetase